MNQISTVSTSVVFLLSSMYGTGTPADAQTVHITAPAEASTVKVNVQDRQAVISYLQTEYADTPILMDIARCESQFRQYDADGNLLHGKVNPNDVGVMQINEKFHADTAKKLGFDLTTIEGNVAYAKYLYKTQGAAPWKSSSACWNSASLTMNK